MKFPVEEYLSAGVDLDESVTMHEAIGVLSIDDEDQLDPRSLARCVNVRSLKIQCDIKSLPASIRQLRKLRKISITSYELRSLPAWLDELEDLRHLSLDRCSDLKKIPDSVWRCPRLEKLWLFHTTFKTLDGIENSPALRELTVFSDELEPQLPAIAKRLATSKGVLRATAELNTLTIERKPTARPPARPKDAGALLSNLPLRFDCSGIDLRGATFEDLDIEVDLRDAKLDHTTWRRCRFQHTNMTGASAEGALFDHCYFEFNATLEKLQAAGITFRSCSTGGSLEGSVLRGAKIESTVPDSLLKLSGCDLREAQIEAVYSTPRNGSHVNLKNADLRGAHVQLRLTEEAAKRVTKSRTKFSWKRATTTGAKTDKTTVIEHVALAQTKTAETRPVGPVATAAGTLCGSNAALWFVVADAVSARGWRGSQLNKDYEELPGTDFSRAMDVDEGPIKVGEGKGVVVQVGDCGCSRLWVDGQSWCLLDGRESSEVDRKSQRGEMLIGSRVAQLASKDTTVVGRFEVQSGCMTLLLPYRKNPFTEKHAADAKKSGEVRGVSSDHDALLVPAPNGTYEIVREKLSHKDEVGSFSTRVRIAPAGSQRAKAKPGKSPGATRRKSGGDGAKSQSSGGAARRKSSSNSAKSSR